MKPKLTTITMIFGLILAFGPMYLFDSLNWFWYCLAVTGGVLVAIAGKGAQMEMMGQGDTGEELLQEIWERLKSKFKRKEGEE